MQLCTPDWRWRQILKAQEQQTLPDDSFASFVYSVLTKAKDAQDSPDVVSAVENILDVEYRDHLVAFILSGASPATICKCLDLRLEVFNIFSKLYLDVETFRHRMERRRYAKYYVAHVCADPDAGPLIQKGVIEGSSGIEAFWNRPEEKIAKSPKEMYRSITEMAYTKSIVARYSDLTAEETKESLRWVNTTIKALTKVDIMQFDDNEGDGTSLVNIKQQDYTHTAEELGLTTADILN